jgi:hypothetical protein
VAVPGMKSRSRHFLLVNAFIAIVLSFPVIGPVAAQEQPDSPDYREIFGSDYTWAENLLELNAWWADTLEAHGLDARFALAIIFPELIRYSSILDYIEVKALEVLYVQYGRDYADFSIGYFQMKPSFAEHIEADILNYHLVELYPHLDRLQADTSDNTSRRADRITMLQDENFQLLYLEAFICIMDHLILETNRHLPSNMKLEFYATAYNAGYFKDVREISEEMKKERFYTGLDDKKKKYNYSSIALPYFLRKQD